MIYRLHRNGQNLGSFPLAELRRRRLAGELDGNEFARREGMADWERLDDVLVRQTRNEASPAPPPLPRSARRDGLHPVALTAIIAGVCLFVASLAFVAYRTYRTITTASRILPIISARNQRLQVNTRLSALTAASKPVVWTTNTLTIAQVRKLP